MCLLSLRVLLWPSLVRRGWFLHANGAGCELLRDELKRRRPDEAPAYARGVKKKRRVKEGEG